MPELTLEQFEDQTSLLPGLIAERLGEQRQIKRVTEFVEHSEARTLHLFNVNEQFKRQMIGASSREQLYMWIEHWLDAWIARGEMALEEKRATL